MTLEQQLREAVESVVVDVYRAGLINTVPMGYNSTTRLLATRFPPACNTCKGEGFELRRGVDGTTYFATTDCPDCPTLGQLLLWGANVATAKAVYTKDGPFVRLGGILYELPDDVLFALREERP